MSNTQTQPLIAELVAQMDEMSNYKVPERAEMTFAAVRHETGDELEALGEGCRVAAAEELRCIAGLYKTQADRERDRAIRLGGTGAPKWQHESSIASAQELASFVRVLRERADALDPEGATR